MTATSAEAVACKDPACPGLAEPEQDGDHTYYECDLCGYSFGFERAETVAVNPDGACSVGIPESVRRVASQPMTNVLAAQPQLPLLTIGRPRATGPALPPA